MNANTNKREWLEDDAPETRLDRRRNSPERVVSRLLDETSDRVRVAAPIDIQTRVRTVELARDLQEKLNITQRVALAKLATQIIGREFDEKHLPAAIRALAESGLSVVRFEHAVYFPIKQFDIDPLAFGHRADKEGYRVSEKVLVVETGRPPETTFVPQGKEMHGVVSVKRNDPFDTEIRETHQRAKRYERLGQSVIPAASRSFKIPEVRQVIELINKRKGMPKNVKARLLTPMEWEILRLGEVIDLNDHPTNSTGEIFDNDDGFGYPQIVEAHGVGDERMSLVDRENKNGSTFRVAFELPS